MAGSFSHVMGGIYNLDDVSGDALEAIEEMAWLILSEIGEERAHVLLNEKFYPMARGEIEEDDAYIETRKLMGF